jgi:hypothetical protein
MAGFYHEDSGQKKCPSLPKLCEGPTCALFSWINKFYAYCGYEPKPGKDDLVHPPLNLGAGFVWREYTEGVVPLIKAPMPPKDAAKPK